ncbi:MAG: ABC transporter ATP-binding protein, partial [Spirochaetaceae bacterium]|nr:ABC transporter ATP-binding protein [Spirochaetaceae bacterium]
MIIKDLTFSYGNELIFDHFNVEIPTNKICTIVGGSGCGKSTLLKLIASLLEHDSGHIIFEKGESGSMSYLFQEPRLLENENVYSNVELVLRNSILDKKERKNRVFYYLDRVGLLDERTKFPFQLSGGMKQRVAIARAFAYPSNLILMDEPMQGLDIKSRQIVLGLFADLWENEPRTTLFVTHDLRDAITRGSSVLALGNPKAPVDFIDMNNFYPLSDEKYGTLEKRLLDDILI